MKEISEEDFYDSPLFIQADAMRILVKQEQERQILKAIQNIGIEINKEDLVEALNNDRRRYEDAYRKGYAAAINKEELIDMMPVYESVPHCGKCGYRLQDDWQICPKCKARIRWGNKKE